uniref:Uncharacterized protein n=1 Tax=Cacopsylla melanoneura TaxID=428564 RepID=A0A8D9EB28_9HEMI
MFHTFWHPNHVYHTSHFFHRNLSNYLLNFHRGLFEEPQDVVSFVEKYFLHHLGSLAFLIFYGVSFSCCLNRKHYRLHYHPGNCFLDFYGIDGRLYRLHVFYPVCLCVCHQDEDLYNLCFFHLGHLYIFRGGHLYLYPFHLI